MKNYISVTLIGLLLGLFSGCAQNGFVSLFDGKTLDAWKIPEGDNGHWRVADGVIDYDGQSEAAQEKDLWSKKEYQDFILKVEWRFSGGAAETEVPVILPDGNYELNADSTQKKVKVLSGGDSGIYLRGNSKSQINIWCWPIGSGEVYGYRNDPNVSPEVRQGLTPKMNADKPVGEWNAFVIQMVGDRLTVDLNGQRVIENAQLPGVPVTGPIALQHHGDKIQFREIWIKEL
jgi:hypothetical protein